MSALYDIDHIERTFESYNLGNKIWLPQLFPLFRFIYFPVTSCFLSLLSASRVPHALHWEVIIPSSSNTESASRVLLSSHKEKKGVRQELLMESISSVLQHIGEAFSGQPVTKWAYSLDAMQSIWAAWQQICDPCLGTSDTGEYVEEFLQ